MDKLKSNLLKVPYIHTVFTLPHQLNSLARNNESVLYSLIMKVAWLTFRNIGAKAEYTPGMTSILHTFGSDMKYHTRPCACDFWRFERRRSLDLSPG
ncbi:MAG: hypothetical protein IPJ51_01925 [Saprospiraceae bacterium]|nr:hypothetical protein [Saprospiraceae bacterium]